ncbi:NAD-P-binding protein [Mycena galericulata]|nr:NAD-P-binding protein [Mycena galericulata]
MALPLFSFTTTADEVATGFQKEIQGKNVLLTGTSVNGIGFETARALAKYANLVMITGHNSERLKAAEEAIKREVPSGNIRPLLLDLSSFASVRKVAAEVNAYPEPLHVLIHNAAATIGNFKLTVDNLESQAATDHVGPFLLTKLLAAKLLATKTASYTPRVVFVASIGHGFTAGVDFSTFGRPDQVGYERLETYHQAKAANVLTAIELSKRSRGQINAYSLHPGAIYTNIMQHKETVGTLTTFGLLGPDGVPNSGFPWKTIPQGAATTVAAAFDPSLNDKPGAYLADCVAANELVAPSCFDPVNAEKLWTLTEEMIGESFKF